mmetsp:Transcript_550/g.1583  ORF Transcript_550/g.1583 Transcript_550/m.1583 type:complete len:317 (-) Transcript_550:43-993(-)
MSCATARTGPPSTSPRTCWWRTGHGRGWHSPPRAVGGPSRSAPRRCGPTSGCTSCAGAWAAGSTRAGSRGTSTSGSASWTSPRAPPLIRRPAAARSCRTAGSWSCRRRAIARRLRGARCPSSTTTAAARRSAQLSSSGRRMSPRSRAGCLWPARRVATGSRRPASTGGPPTGATRSPGRPSRRRVGRGRCAGAPSRGATTSGRTSRSRSASLKWRGHTQGTASRARPGGTASPRHSQAWGCATGRPSCPRATRARRVLVPATLRVPRCSATPRWSDAPTGGARSSWTSRRGATTCAGATQRAAARPNSWWMPASWL